ncbi:Endochitinase [Dactylella cylindrospora]|nr:Endochitinase [Dactylella cylindrospora]
MAHLVQLVAFWLCALVTLLIAPIVSALDLTGSDNLALYWGQNSAGRQLPLKEYCARPNVDIVILSFIYQLQKPDMIPILNHASNQCSLMGAGPQITCPEIAKDIDFCHSKGKKIMISLGGAVGDYMINSVEEAEKAAVQIWNTFLGGKGTGYSRPYGDVELDGVDLDLEVPQLTAAPFWVDFIRKMRDLYQNDASRSGRKDFLISGAPQCPYPDVIFSECLKHKTAWFDMMFVQFYNNYCGLHKPADYNFGTWANWARNDSLNPNVKIFIGAPGGPAAATAGGYVDQSTLINVAGNTMRDSEPAPVPGERGNVAPYNPMGGVAFWDASWTSPEYTSAIKDALRIDYDEIKAARGGGNTPEYWKKDQVDAAAGEAEVKEYFPGPHGRLHRRHRRSYRL